jgi:hypothetical protein
MDLFPCWYGFVEVAYALLLAGKNDKNQFEADKELLNIVSKYCFKWVPISKSRCFLG